ncbi:hypothetical protein [Deinococcus multiflagellatus]|uniref:hypothetical protein n=1 Tax=Deinococcus multiflagellatus TaxID=1656887 RepID=UPI001CCC66E5|nr:hypothetical protein [Deinococcus multiflagellatus]MBZ9712187.1 hypothetical protein [Deinococcus multiflagellatus]
MTQGVQPTTKAQGAAVPSLALLGLYETRRGMFGPQLTLWEGGAATAAGTTTVQGTGDQTAQGGGERRMTDAEWRQMRRTQLDGADLKELVNKVIDLEASNFKLRQRETPEGGKSLTPDEAKEWEAYRALGKPADLKTELETGKLAVTERDTLKRSAEVATVADVAKAKASVLTERLDRDSLSAKVQGEGDKRAVHVFDKDGKDLGELKTYAQQHWADYVPALFPTDTQTTQSQGGTAVTGQAGASAGTGSNGLHGYAAKVLADRQAAANPTPPAGGTA